jgi:hypothetical protein
MTVTGEQLHRELCEAASAAGVSVQKFARPLFSEPNWKLEQMRIAKHPPPADDRAGARAVHRAADSAVARAICPRSAGDRAEPCRGRGSWDPPERAIGQ